MTVKSWTSLNSRFRQLGQIMCGHWENKEMAVDSFEEVNTINWKFIFFIINANT